MTKIAFITEGGLEMGMGHITRTLTLAEELRDKAEISFLTKSDETVVNQIKDVGFNTFRVGSDREMLVILQKITPSVVIIDKLEVDESFAKNLKNSLKTLLVIFENTSAANNYADVVVNAVFGSEFKNRTFFDRNTKTQYFYGPKYWILRNQFRKFMKNPETASGKVAKILLIFGGSDPSNLTSAVVEELLNLNKGFAINVILGAHFEYLDSLNLVLARHPLNKKDIKVYKNIKNVAELMHDADLVMASPGLSVFEALCVGTPLIVIHQNLWQQNGFKGFVPTLDKSELGKLGSIIDDESFIDPRSNYILALKIGEGKEEVINSIMGN